MLHFSLCLITRLSHDEFLTYYIASRNNDGIILVTDVHFYDIWCRVNERWLGSNYAKTLVLHFLVPYSHWPWLIPPSKKCSFNKPFICRKSTYPCIIMLRMYCTDTPLVSETNAPSAYHTLHVLSILANLTLYLPKNLHCKDRRFSPNFDGFPQCYAKISMQYILKINDSLITESNFAFTNQFQDKRFSRDVNMFSDNGHCTHNTDPMRNCVLG